MAKYQISTTLRSGQGEAFINGLPITDEGYEEGLTLTFNWVTDATFDAITVRTRGNYIPLQTTASFDFTMPSRDVEFQVTLSVWEIQTASYGLKFYYEFGDTDRNCKRIEILERGYEGEAQVRKLNNVIRRFGDRDSNPVETFIFSSMDVTFVANNTEYWEFITGDVRKYQLVLKYGTDVKFKGYIKPDYITSPERTNVNHEVKLTAFDGLDDFGAIRLDPSKLPNRETLSGFAPFSQRAIKLIALALNQSFEDGRNINISCDFYETRMNEAQGMFEQWTFGENAIFNDGENPRFVEDNSKRVINEYLSLEEVLTRVLNPFICNVFLWEDEFYIIRVEELIKPNIRFFKYDSNAVFLESFTLANDQEDTCILANGQIANGLRTGRAVFTRFTASLRLGVFLPEVSEGMFEYRFERTNWFSAVDPLSLANERLRLKYWDYVNATPLIISSQTPRTGDVAGVAYNSEDGEYCRIWTTTTDAGLSDPNLSYIERTLMNVEDEYGTNRGPRPEAFLAFETSNIISFEAECRFDRASSNSPSIPQNLQVAFQIQVGDFYLFQDGDLFDWTLTPTIIAFDVVTSIRQEITIGLQTEPLPTSGIVTIRLYQLINLGGQKDKYLIDWKFAKIELAQNEALVTNEIKKQFNTFVPYSKIYPEYKTYLGDSISNQSTSAMRLMSGDVTEAWGEDEVGLLDNLVQSLANIFGRSNVSVFGNMVKTIWSPVKALQYKGRYWKINHLSINEIVGEVTNIDLFDLGEIVEPVTDVDINWEVFEGPPFIDANMRIYVNDILRVEKFDNGTGTLLVQVGDIVRVQYFYLANLIDPGMVNPRLQFLKDDLLLGSHVIVPTESQTQNFTFEVLSANIPDISILVQSIET